MDSTKYLLSVDAGVSSGIALFRYSDNSAAELEYCWQFRGGLTGFIDWYDFEDPPWHRRNLTVVAEKFLPRPVSGFSYTADTLEPLRIEGAMVTLKMLPDYQHGGKNPNWQAPALQYFAGGKDKAEKKRRQHRWLKDHGFYVTNKQFPDSPAKDGADDARSAIAHGLVWFRRQKHLPTLSAYFRDEETPEE